MPETSFLDGFKVPFRNFVLKDVEISSLIEGRFYGQQLATFYTNSTSFPLAVFYVEGGNMPNMNIIQRFPLRIQAYSNQSYDEAYWVYTPIFEILGGQNGPVTISNRINVRPISTPVETYDEVARLYGVTGRFNVIWIP